MWTKDSTGTRTPCPRATAPSGAAILSPVYGSYGAFQGPFEDELAKALRNPANEKGKLPPWYPRFPGWEEIQTTPAIKMVEIIVCGDPARNKVQTLAGGAGVAIK